MVNKPGGLVGASEELARAWDEFFDEICKELKLVQIVDWLNEQLCRIWIGGRW